MRAKATNTGPLKWRNVAYWGTLLFIYVSTCYFVKLLQAFTPCIMNNLCKTNLQSNKFFTLEFWSTNTFRIGAKRTSVHENESSRFFIFSLSSTLDICSIREKPQALSQTTWHCGRENKAPAATNLTDCSHFAICLLWLFYFLDLATQVMLGAQRHG